MVKHVSSVGRNGVHDFLLVRATAILMALYTVYLVCFFAFSGDLTYGLWLDFWSGTFTKVFTMIALVCVLIHGWIGLWQVLTDYVKSAPLRGLLQLAVIAVLLGYFFSGLFVLWGA
ncbi:succinate dehydrogenase, hydrophobic membrane anchor protein [Vibrio mangrovi]|uniref:Succinate dehydrogenase hydrophobic membrane anchor subunit n=1 Tax=Vibrio mangrovi TaxID=474394 RepID=A0A1Y6IS91_9VIBR|nr:succinate dehydrogenase, hydrophobic membrane anchor protein [Vibrio mangrovi]MDW6001481.1 succinate dehydrogenase, hydrophobic membrane anchor protein [Vibrio mangrovi]SMS00496.1 Succinate dehydrogenase hydrophobic membrane anchor subunit [Vibrio mangrovi]